MIIQICVGSSCHLKGSPEIVELLTQEVKDHKLEDEITLAGSFCIGKCNRVGVTVQVDDVIHTGINRENFKEFFNDKVLSVIENERK
ncbi:MAG: (2Fe-2S) ferredoxin domain-containing protein [Tyzzerella sp.]|nr:(2Fe-2S) ferredoxin domain-containing protein [Tyzzerella sp.]